MIENGTDMNPVEWINKSLFYLPDKENALTSVPFHVLYRSNYTSKPPTPPSYTIYTGIDLSTAFIFFWIHLVIQTMIILVARLLTCKRFRQIEIFSQLVHSLDSINIPDVYQDWDAGQGDVEDYKKQFKSVMKEMGAMVTIQWVSNICLLIPLIYTGK